MTNLAPAPQKGTVSPYRSLRQHTLEILAMGVLVGSLWSGWACAGASESNLTVTPAQHTVSLSWTASSTTGVQYNIYRAPYTNACGSFSKINSTPQAGTSYTDSNVVNGSSYCYGVKSVNSNNQESDYSNIVLNVQVPAN